MKFFHSLLSLCIYLGFASQMISQEAPNDIASFQKLLVEMTQLHERNSKASQIIIPHLEKLWPQSKFPYRNLLQSLLADEYYKYYLSRLQILRESPPKDFDAQNFHTWDAEKLSSRITELYLESLSNKEKLIQTSSDEFQDIFVDSKIASIYQPSIYAILAQRALIFLEDQRADLHRGDQAFRIKSRQAFVEVDSFISLIFTPADSLSTGYLAIKLYQDLLKHQQTQNNPFPFIYTNIQRLKYARKRSTGQLQRQRYANALQKMAIPYEDHPAVAEIKYELAKLYLERGQSYMPPAVKSYQWDYKAAWDLCEEVNKKFPNTQSAQKCKQLKDIIEQRTLTVDIEEVQLPNKPFRIKLNFRNINRVYIQIIKLNPTLNKSLDALGENHEAQIDFLKKQPAKAWVQDLPDEEDFQLHAIELPMPELSEGKYILLIGDDKNLNTKGHAVAHSRLRVSRLAVIQSPHLNATHFYVMDRETGRPLKDIEVYEPEQKDKVFKTNENGKYVADLSGSFKVHYFVFKVGEDSIEISTRRRYYLPPSRKRLLSRIYSDAKVYQPGSPIYFRGIAYFKKDQSLSAIIDSSIYVRLINADEEIIRDTTVHINQYGSFHGHFLLPAHETGHYMLISQGGSYLFQVKAAEPSHFSIQLRAEKKDFKYWDTVFVQGQILPFVGADMPETTIQYRVVRQSLFPYWYSYSWWRPELQNERVIAARGKTSTDSSGHFVIPFLAIPDLELGTDEEVVYNYTVYAEATSLAGEEHHDTIEIRIGRPQLAVKMDMPTISEISDPLKIKIETKSLYGAKCPIQGRLRIFPLEAPTNTYRKRQWSQPDMHILDEATYHDLFPHDVYGYEDDFRSWSVDSAIVDTSINTSTDSVWVFGELIQQLAGQYRVRLDMEDPYGNSLKVVEYTTRYNPLSALPPIPTSLSYSLGQLEAQPGDKVQLGLFTSEPDLWVLVEWGTQYKIDTAMLIRMEHFRYGGEIPIQTSHKGSVMVRISTVIHNEFHSYIQRIEVPWKEKEIEISESSKPQDKAFIQLQTQASKDVELLPQFIYSHYTHINHFPISIFPRNRWIGTWASKGFSIARSGLVATQWRINAQNLKLPLETYTWRKDSLPLYAPLDDQENLENDIWAYERSRMAPANNSSNFPSALIGLQHDFKSRLQSNYLEHLITKPRVSEKIQRSYHPPSFYPSFYPPINTSSNESSWKYDELPMLGKWKFRTIAHNASLQTGIYEREFLIQKPLIGHIRTPKSLEAGTVWDCYVRVYNFSQETAETDVSLSLRFYVKGKMIKDVSLPQKSILLSKENGLAKLYFPVEIINGADSLSLALILRTLTNKSKQYFSTKIQQIVHNQSIKKVVFIDNKLKLKTKFKELFKVPQEKLQTTHAYNITLTTTPALFAIPYLKRLYTQNATDTRTISQRLFSYHALQMLDTISLPKDHAKDLLRLIRDRQNENGSFCWQLELGEEQKLTMNILQKIGWIQEWLAPNWRQRPLADSAIYRTVYYADSVILSKRKKKDIEPDIWDYLNMRAYFSHIEVHGKVKPYYEQLIDDINLHIEDFSDAEKLIFAKLCASDGEKEIAQKILASISIESTVSQPNFLELASLWTTLSYQIANDENRLSWVNAVLNYIETSGQLSNEALIFALQVLILTPHSSPSLPSFKLKVGKQKRKVTSTTAVAWNGNFGKAMDRKAGKIKLKTQKVSTLWGKINWINNKPNASIKEKNLYKLSVEIQKEKSRMYLHLETLKDLNYQTITYACNPEIVPEPSKRKIDIREQEIYLANNLDEIKIYIPYLPKGTYSIEVPLVE